VTLICAYLTCWELTKKHGPPELDFVPMSEKGRYESDVLADYATSPMPFVLARYERHGNYVDSAPRGTKKLRPMFPPSLKPTARRCYYIWLFGATIRLPFQSLAPVIFPAPPTKQQPNLSRGRFKKYSVAVKKR
jgi:hypothetical protein